MTERESAFVRYLENLVTQRNRQALAELRRGLSGDPGQQLHVYRYVGRFLIGGETGWNEQRFLLVASLFALYQQGAETLAKSPQAGFGTSFRRLYEATERRPSVERRFLSLIACHTDSLPDHLRHAITLMRSEGVGVDFEQLLSDLSYWNHQEQWVQRRWARQFFRSEELAAAEPQVTSQPDEIPVESEQ
jgi:CRISPR system Cascade subunit CasB